MIPHPDIAAQIAHDRQREMLADAERHNLAAQAKAARSAPRPARTAALRLRQHLAAAIRRAASSPPPAKRSWLRRRAAAILVAVGTSGALALGIASAASASTPVVTMTPQFACYSGSIVADKPLIPENGGTISWLPEILTYNGSQWVHAAWGWTQTVPNTTAGELELSSESFTTSHNAYFTVLDWFYTPADGWVSLLARAEMGGAPVDSYICRTS